VGELKRRKSAKKPERDRECLALPQPDPRSEYEASKEGEGCINQDCDSDCSWLIAR
jgi:hypothetical protein